jgi:hypothetical protein
MTAASLLMLKYQNQFHALKAATECTQEPSPDFFPGSPGKDMNVGDDTDNKNKKRS